MELPRFRAILSPSQGMMEGGNGKFTAGLVIA